MPGQAGHDVSEQGFIFVMAGCDRPSIIHFGPLEIHFCFPWESL
jgi:hypothetical protein